ncbi:MAG: DHH family phosphoesterase [Oscillospiraceae bacterium]|nr:DHH family phosphoesterase [Oscillospiraceae bacterium]
MIPCNVKYDVDLAKIPDLLEFILTNKGVTDMRGFMNPTRGYVNDPFLLQGMDKAVNILRDIAINKPKVDIVVDADVDGITSSTMLVNFFHDNFEVDFNYYLPIGKEHGLNNKRLQSLKESDASIVIIPDAGSSDVDQCKELYEMGKTILIIDHHVFENPDIRKYTTIVNCTDGAYPNVNMSGATMVQKVFDALFQRFGKELNLDEGKRDAYLELCALGTIADSISLTDIETRYYVCEGLKPENAHNECLKQLCYKKDYEMSVGRTIFTMGYYIAPMINAVVRYGKCANEKKNTESELKMLFDAFINKQGVFEYKPRKSKGNPDPQIEYHSLQMTAARLALNAHSRQSKAVSTLVDKLVDKVSDTHKVIVVDGTEDFEKLDHNATGLVANRLMNHFMKPTFVLVNKGGSGRSNAIGRLKDARSFFNESGTIHCEGHPRAFGIKSIDKDAFIKFCDENIKDDELQNAHEVDFMVSPDNIRQKDINEIGDNLHIFGNTINAPIFYIPGIKIRSDKIKGLASLDSDYISTFNFKVNGIEFMKKYCKRNDFNEFTCRPMKGFGEPKPRDLCIDIVAEVYTYIDSSGERKSVLKIMDFHSENLGIVKDTSFDSNLGKKTDTNSEIDKTDFMSFF